MVIWPTLACVVRPNGNNVLNCRHENAKETVRELASDLIFDASSNIKNVFIFVKRGIPMEGKAGAFARLRETYDNVKCPAPDRTGQLFLRQQRHLQNPGVDGLAPSGKAPKQVTSPPPCDHLWKHATLERKFCIFEVPKTDIDIEDQSSQQTLQVWLA